MEHDSGYYASSYSSWLNYGTSLVTNIIENLQLNIKDVHIRHEDDVTLPDGKQFCFTLCNRKYICIYYFLKILRFCFTRQCCCVWYQNWSINCSKLRC